MNKVFVTIGITLFLGTSFIFTASDPEFKSSFGSFTALLFPQTISAFDLQNRYASRDLKILIVPGHDNEYWGSDYQGVREADLNLKLGSILYQKLSTNSHFKVFLTRDPYTGNYTNEFNAYFIREEKAIKTFKSNLQNLMKTLITEDIAEDKSTSNHSFVNNEISNRLYGINRWANENRIDIVLHLHFNDYPRKARTTPGKYSGFTIYVPENQYPNSKASDSVAQSLFNQLKKYLTVSNAPYETSGIVEDHELIAVGANASREGVSLLIEYGYIYEPQVITPALREIFFEQVAEQTKRGLEVYFGNYEADGVKTLRYNWNQNLVKGFKDNRDVLALQLILAKEGMYPPSKKSLRECPINGSFGPCVENAIEAFREKYLIDERKGIVGAYTRAKLNELYGY